MSDPVTEPPPSCPPTPRDPSVAPPPPPGEKAPPVPLRRLVGVDPDGALRWEPELFPNGP